MLINPLFLMQHILYSLYFTIFVLTCLTVCTYYRYLLLQRSVYFNVKDSPTTFSFLTYSKICSYFKVHENSFVPFKMSIYLFRVHTNSTWVEARIRVLWQLFSMRIPLTPFQKSMSDLGSTWLGLQKTIFQFICMWRRWYDLRS